MRFPCFATWCAADLISSEDPLFVGRPGSVASRGANFALQNCDFLLAIGVRLDFAITGFAPDKLAREAQKAMVDIDAAELFHLNSSNVRSTPAQLTPDPEKKPPARRLHPGAHRIALPGADLDLPLPLGNALVARRSMREFGAPTAGFWPRTKRPSIFPFSKTLTSRNH